MTTVESAVVSSPDASSCDASSPLSDGTLRPSSNRPPRPKEGMLRKKDSREYWVVVNGRGLQFFKSIKDTKPRGSMDLCADCSVEDDSNSFTVSCPGSKRPVSFYVRDGSLAEWCQTIEGFRRWNVDHNPVASRSHLDPMPSTKTSPKRKSRRLKVTGDEDLMKVLDMEDAENGSGFENDTARSHNSTAIRDSRPGSDDVSSRGADDRGSATDESSVCSGRSAPRADGSAASESAGRSRASSKVSALAIDETEDDHPRESEGKKVDLVCSIYDFEAEVDGHLSLREGELVYLDIRDANGWWFGRKKLGNQSGWFPSTFVRMVTDGEASMDASVSASIKSKSVVDEQERDEERGTPDPDPDQGSDTDDERASYEDALEDRGAEDVLRMDGGDGDTDVEDGGSTNAGTDESSGDAGGDTDLDTPVMIARNDELPKVSTRSRKRDDDVASLGSDMDLNDVSQGDIELSLPDGNSFLEALDKADEEALEALSGKSANVASSTARGDPLNSMFLSSATRFSADANVTPSSAVAAQDKLRSTDVNLSTLEDDILALVRASREELGGARSTSSKVQSMLRTDGFALAHPDKQGYLQMQRPSSRAFKKPRQRWCLLKETRLYFFKSAGDIHPEGSLNLLQYELRQDPKSTSKLCIVLYDMREDQRDDVLGAEIGKDVRSGGKPRLSNAAALDFPVSRAASVSQLGPLSPDAKPHKGNSIGKRRRSLANVRGSGEPSPLFQMDDANDPFAVGSVQPPKAGSKAAKVLGTTPARPSRMSIRNHDNDEDLGEGRGRRASVAARKKTKPGADRDHAWLLVAADAVEFQEWKDALVAATRDAMEQVLDESIRADQKVEAKCVEMGVQTTGELLDEEHDELLQQLLLQKNEMLNDICALRQSFAAESATHFERARAAKATINELLEEVAHLKGRLSGSGEVDAGFLQRRSDGFEFPLAIVEYDWSAQEATQLDLVEGNEIYVIKQLASGWWQGYPRDGEIEDARWFPCSYARIVERTRDVECQTELDGQSLEEQHYQLIGLRGELQDLEAELQAERADHSEIAKRVLKMVRPEIESMQKQLNESRADCADLLEKLDASKVVVAEQESELRSYGGKEHLASELVSVENEKLKRDVFVLSKSLEDVVAERKALEKRFLALERGDGSGVSNVGVLVSSAVDGGVAEAKGPGLLREDERRRMSELQDEMVEDIRLLEKESEKITEPSAMSEQVEESTDGVAAAKQSLEQQAVEEALELMEFFEKKSKPVAEDEWEADRKARRTTSRVFADSQVSALEGAAVEGAQELMDLMEKSSEAAAGAQAAESATSRAGKQSVSEEARRAKGGVSAGDRAPASDMSRVDSSKAVLLSPAVRPRRRERVEEAAGPGSGSRKTVSGSAGKDRVDIARVLFDWESAGERGMISLHQGERVLVVGRDKSGWWEGRRADAQRGWFPSNYVKVLRPAHASDAGYAEAVRGKRTTLHAAGSSPSKDRTRSESPARGKTEEKVERRSSVGESSTATRASEAPTGGSAEALTPIAEVDKELEKSAGPRATSPSTAEARLEAASPPPQEQEETPPMKVADRSVEAPPERTDRPPKLQRTVPVKRKPRPGDGTGPKRGEATTGGSSTRKRAGASIRRAGASAVPSRTREVAVERQSLSFAERRRVFEQSMR